MRDWRDAFAHAAPALRGRSQGLTRTRRAGSGAPAPPAHTRHRPRPHLAPPHRRSAGPKGPARALTIPRSARRPRAARLGSTHPDRAVHRAGQPHRSPCCAPCPSRSRPPCSPPLASSPAIAAPAPAAGGDRTQGRDHRGRDPRRDREATATTANEVSPRRSSTRRNVVKVYSPNATSAKVKAAVNGASIVVYLGHGNGWPSPYTYDPNYTTKDGFGLNADLNDDGKLSDYENKYYGEPWIRTLTPAPNAVVLLFHLCYASGNSEPGNADPDADDREEARRQLRRGVPPGRRQRRDRERAQPRPVLHRRAVHDPPDDRRVLAQRPRLEQRRAHLRVDPQPGLHVPARSRRRRRLLPLDRRQDDAHDDPG